MRSTRNILSVLMLALTGLLGGCAAPPLMEARNTGVLVPSQAPQPTHSIIPRTVKRGRYLYEILPVPIGCPQNAQLKAEIARAGNTPMTPDEQMFFSGYGYIPFRLNSDCVVIFFRHRKEYVVVPLLSERVQGHTTLRKAYQVGEALINPYNGNALEDRSRRRYRHHRGGIYFEWNNYRYRRY